MIILTQHRPPYFFFFIVNQMSPVDVAPPAVPSQTPLSSIKRKKKKNFKNRTSLAPAAVMDVDVDAVVNDGEAIALLVPDEVDDLLPSSPATTTPPASLSLKKLAGGKLGQCKIIFTKDSR